MPNRVHNNRGRFFWDLKRLRYKYRFTEGTACLLCSLIFCFIAVPVSASSVWCRCKGFKKRWFITNCLDLLSNTAVTRRNLCSLIKVKCKKKAAFSSILIFAFSLQQVDPWKLPMGLSSSTQFYQVKPDFCKYYQGTGVLKKVHKY